MSSRALRRSEYPTRETWFPANPYDTVSPYLESPDTPIQVDFSLSVLIPHMSLFGASRPDLEPYKNVPATNPPTQSLCLQFCEPFLQLSFPISSETFISVFDVLERAHTCLCLPLLPGLFHYEDLVMIYAAYAHRVMTIADPELHGREVTAGVKNLDRLQGKYHFAGVHWSPTAQERCTFRISLSELAPGVQGAWDAVMIE